MQLGIRTDDFNFNYAEVRKILYGKNREELLGTFLGSKDLKKTSYKCTPAKGEDSLSFGKTKEVDF